MTLSFTFYLSREIYKVFYEEEAIRVWCATMKIVSWVRFPGVQPLYIFHRKGANKNEQFIKLFKDIFQT